MLEILIGILYPILTLLIWRKMELSERITELSTHTATIIKSLAADVDKKQAKENWFTLCTGFLTNEDLTSIASGKVKKYTYQGGAIRYRFIANNGSEDSFYINYSNGVFTNLVASRKITI